MYVPSYPPGVEVFSELKYCPWYPLGVDALSVISTRVSCIV